jgi:peroxiredoxin Q/BCP
MKLEIGQLAPDFNLPDQDGTMHALKSYHGQYVLVYFYPKDDTPGCTTEACSIRDNFPTFKELPIKVFGISADSVKSHKKFADKYQLPFALLADQDKQAVKAYGVWGEKKFMGRIFDGIKRSSFLIDREGKLVKIYENVKPKEHVAEVLEDLKELLEK